MKTWKTMKILLTASAMAFIASSCDDGKIYPQISEAEGSGRVLEIKVRFTNVDQWPSTEDYCVLFAGFKEDGTYPSISKNIGTPVEGKDMEFTVSPGMDDQKYVVQKGKLEKCIVYGPGRLTLAHKADEYANIEEMKTALRELANERLFGAK